MANVETSWRREPPSCSRSNRRHGSGAGRTLLPTPSTSDRGWGSGREYPRQTGMTSGWGPQRRVRNATKAYTACSDDTGAIASAISQRSQNLGPHGDHAEKQGDRGQGSGFLHNGAKHDLLPERRKNIVHVMFYCQVPECRRAVSSPWANFGKSSDFASA